MTQVKDRALRELHGRFHTFKEGFMAGGSKMFVSCMTMKRVSDDILAMHVRLAFILVILMASAVTAAPEPLLSPCPSSPNCVSSLAQDSHFIAPLIYSGDSAPAFARLRDILSRRPDTKIIIGDDTKLQVEFRTLLGFVDDGLFVLDSADSVIQCRSAARVGYWDLGKNRRRMEEIRQQFQRQHGRLSMNVPSMYE